MSARVSLLAAVVVRFVVKWEEAAVVANGGFRMTGRELLAEWAGCKSY